MPHPKAKQNTTAIIAVATAKATISQSDHLPNLVFGLK